MGSVSAVEYLKTNEVLSNARLRISNWIDGEGESQNKSILVEGLVLLLRYHKVTVSRSLRSALRQGVYTLSSSTSHRDAVRCQISLKALRMRTWP